MHSFASAVLRTSAQLVFSILLKSQPDLSVQMDLVVDIAPALAGVLRHTGRVQQKQSWCVWFQYADTDRGVLC